ncbi:MAG: flagellar basal body-associated FliL family protein [Catonella sp.]
MKKNMLTIVAIALSFVNLVLTAVIMLSVVSSAKATNALVSNIASIIDLELENNTSTNKIVMSDMDVVNFDVPLQINLKGSGDGKDHYAVIDQTSIYLIKTAEDYKTLSESMKNADTKTGYGSTIGEIVNNQFSQYTKEEVQNNKEAIKMAVLKAVQEKFGTQTIAEIAFKNLRLQ